MEAYNGAFMPVRAADFALRSWAPPGWENEGHWIPPARAAAKTDPCCHYDLVVALVRVPREEEFTRQLAHSDGVRAATGGPVASQPGAAVSSRTQPAELGESAEEGAVAACARSASAILAGGRTERLRISIDGR